MTITSTQSMLSECNILCIYRSNCMHVYVIHLQCVITGKCFFSWKLHENYIYYTCYIGKTSKTMKYVLTYIYYKMLHGNYIYYICYMVKHISQFNLTNIYYIKIHGNYIYYICYIVKHISQFITKTYYISYISHVQ